MNLLFTSAGRRQYLLQWFKEALNGAGSVHAANSDPNASAFAASDARVITPPIHSKEYISFLLSYCTSNHIDAVIPLFDVDLPVLAANYQLFQKEGVEVVVSSEEITRTCNDKLAMSRFLAAHRIDTPTTFADIATAKKAVAEGMITFPLMLKPRWGMGSIGVYMVEDAQELEVFYRKVRKEIAQSYLRFESGADPAEAVLIQERLDGQEYGLDVVNDLQGQHVVTFVKQKLAMRSGETDVACTMDDPQMVELGRSLASVLKHRGNLDVDVFRTSAGKVKVLEMNARFGGGYPFSHLAGAHLPRAILAWLRKEQYQPDDLRIRMGVVGIKSIGIIERSW